MLVVPSLSPRLRSELQALHLLRLQLRLRLLDDLHTEPFLGNLMRGQVGAVLHEQSPTSFQALMGDDAGARLWTLEAPWADAPWLPAGAALDCWVTLIGPGCSHAPALIDAFAGLAVRGLGPARPPLQGQRAGVRLEAVHRLDLPGPPAQECGTSALAVFEASPGQPQAGLRLQFHRPVRFKQHGRVLLQPPEPEALLRRALGRVVQLLPPPASSPAGSSAPEAPPHGLFQPEEHAAWMQLARQSNVTSHDLQACQWQRHSRRTGHDMPLEGMVGAWHLDAPGGGLLPWFRLMEWLHLGSKTTFGFGALKADLLPATPHTTLAAPQFLPAA